MATAATHVRAVNTIMLGGDVLKPIDVPTALGTPRQRMGNALDGAPRVRLLGPADIAADPAGPPAPPRIRSASGTASPARQPRDRTISFAAGLRYARERAGLSRIDLAVAACVPIRRLRHLERGGDATSWELERLAHTLGLSPREIVAADRVIVAPIAAAVSEVIDAAARLSPAERAALARASVEPAHREAVARCSGHLRSSGRGPLVDDARRRLRKEGGGLAAVSVSTITAILAADLVPPRTLALGLGPWRATVGRLDRLRSIRRRSVGSLAAARPLGSTRPRLETRGQR